MLDKIVAGYRKAEMGIISGLSGNTARVLDETRFYDWGYMQSQIERVKKELATVTEKLTRHMESQKDTDRNREYQAQLMAQREQLLAHMVFLASNSLANLDSCVSLAEGHDWEFMRCVQALRAYASGKKAEAFQLLEEYYRRHGSVDDHFLANKVFGLLLAQNGQFSRTIPYLTYALQFVPDDIESLEALQTCYERTGSRGRQRVVSEILALLGR